MLEVYDAPEEHTRAQKARAFKGHMRATYRDSERAPHGISALCLFAHFLHGEYTRDDGTGDAATLAGLDCHHESSLALVKQHGTSFVDPALEFMGAPPALPWERCGAPDPRQVLHRSQWGRRAPRPPPSSRRASGAPGA
jgi:hypothetical protein